MTRFITSLAFAVAVAASPAFALAATYQTSSSVSVDTAYAAGEGSVDFDRPSSLEATISVDKVSITEAYATAGDVQNGARGYGFAVIGQMLYAVTNNGGIAQKMPIAFVFPGIPTHVKAVYAPGESLRIDTDSIGSGFTQYSRGVVFGSLPTTGLFPALNASASNATLTIGSWKYAD